MYYTNKEWNQWTIKWWKTVYERIITYIIIKNKLTNVIIRILFIILDIMISLLYSLDQVVLLHYKNNHNL